MHQIFSHTVKNACENTMRRHPSTSQRNRLQEKLNMLTTWPVVLASRSEHQCCLNKMAKFMEPTLFSYPGLGIQVNPIDNHGSYSLGSHKPEVGIYILL